VHVLCNLAPADERPPPALLQMVRARRRAPPFHSRRQPRARLPPAPHAPDAVRGAERADRREAQCGDVPCAARTGACVRHVAVESPLGCPVSPPAPLPSRTNWTRLVHPSRTNWTRLVHPSVLTGHVSPPAPLANRTRRSPPRPRPPPPPWARRRLSAQPPRAARPGRAVPRSAPRGLTARRRTPPPPLPTVAPTHVPTVHSLC
jgi:hypothetical protein